MVKCEIEREKLEGVFWLRWEEDRKTIGGYLLPSLKEIFIFDPQECELSSDWQFVLEFSKRLLDMDYKFPADLQVTQQNMNPPSSTP
jgi:hypothetical protein